MSAYTTRLKLEKQVSGENSGNWGNLVNYVLNRIDSTVRGYVAVSVAGSANVTLVSNTSTTNTAEAADDQVHNKVIEFTGALTGAIHVFTDAVEGDYTLFNNTSGSHVLTFANTGHAANGVAITQGQKALVYTTGSTIVDVLAGAGLVTLSGTQTLTNKTLTAPKIGTSILDTGGNELFLLTATGSAVNQLTYNNASTGNNPTFTASGNDTNIGLNLVPKGTGVLQGAGSALKIAGLETMWVPAAAMYGATTNPADAQQVETTATRPDLKVLDFDAGTDEFAQFTVAFPKSWNAGTVTYQVYWSASNTNTGNCIFGLQGISLADNDTIDQAYGTAVNITDAGIGAVEDQQISAVSSAVTISNVGDDKLTYFQLFRDANNGSDTFTGDARVLGIKIFFTTDAANDA